MGKALLNMQAECPSCGARLAVPAAGVSHHRVQCPKCLNIIDNTPHEPLRTHERRTAKRAPGPPREAQRDGATARRESDVQALIVDATVLQAENLSLKSKLEGLLAEREAILEQHVAFVDEIRDLKQRLAELKDRARHPERRAVRGNESEQAHGRIARLESDLERTRRRLAAAEAALRDASTLMLRLADFEKQVLGLGRACAGIVPAAAGVESPGAGSRRAEAIAPPGSSGHDID